MSPPRPRTKEVDDIKSVASDKPTVLTQQGVEAAYSSEAPIKQDRCSQTAEQYLPDHLKLTCSTDKPDPFTQGDHHQTLVVDCKPREFEIHVPPNYDPSKPLPVMYVLHGVNGSIEQMKQESGLNNVADKKGMIVVYLQALPKKFEYGIHNTSWNLDGGSLSNKASDYDDVNYFKEVDRSVSSGVNVDTSAKYLAGFSEGGAAAQYLAHVMPNTFAGVASVHGTHLEDDPLPPQSSGTPFITVLGDKDKVLPLEGKSMWLTHTARTDVSHPYEQAEAWAQSNNCSSGETKDDGKNKVTKYSCNTGDVVQIIRHKGEHAWDGNGLDGKGKHGSRIFGMPDTSQDSSNDIAEFLLKYHRNIDGTLKICRSFE